MVLILMGNSGAGCGAVQYFGGGRFGGAGHQPIQEFMGEHYGFAGQNGVVSMHEGYSIGAARIWRGVGNSSDAAGKVQLRISCEPMSHGTYTLGVHWHNLRHVSCATDAESFLSDAIVVSSAEATFDEAPLFALQPERSHDQRSRRSDGAGGGFRKGAAEAMALAAGYSAGVAEERTCEPAVAVGAVTVGETTSPFTCDDPSQVRAVSGTHD